MDSSLAPEQVANILETQIPTLSLLDSDSNGITFQYQTEDILVDGIIQRWQGTESHIEIVAELNQALLSNTERNTVIGIVVGGAVIISYFIVQLLLNAECLTRDVYDVCREYSSESTYLTIAFIVMWFGVLGFIWAMRKYDPKIARRWQTQQQLAVVIEEIFDHIQQQDIDSHTINSLLVEDSANEIQINEAKRVSSSND